MNRQTNPAVDQPRPTAAQRVVPMATGTAQVNLQDQPKPKAVPKKPSTPRQKPGIRDAKYRRDLLTIKLMAQRGQLTSFGINKIQEAIEGRRMGQEKAKNIQEDLISDGVIVKQGNRYQRASA